MEGPQMADNFLAEDSFVVEECLGPVAVEIWENFENPGVIHITAPGKSVGLAVLHNQHWLIGDSLIHRQQLMGGRRYLAEFLLASKLSQIWADHSKVWDHACQECLSVCSGGLVQMWARSLRETVVDHYCCEAAPVQASSSDFASLLLLRLRPPLWAPRPLFGWWCQSLSKAAQSILKLETQDK